MQVSFKTELIFFIQGTYFRAQKTFFGSFMKCVFLSNQGQFKELRIYVVTVS